MNSKILSAALITSMGLAVLIPVRGQDIHFSQNTEALQYLNPAMAGFFNGEQRVQLNYRDQWKSIGGSFRTYALAADMNTMKLNWKGGNLGVGLLALSDRAGEMEMGLNRLGLSVSGIVPVSKNQGVSVGLQGNVNQRSINGENLKWGNQFDGSSGAYNPALSSGETGALNPFLFVDFGAGVAWNYFTSASTLSTANQREITAGVSVSHVNRPEQRWYSSGNKEPLFVKYTIHANGFIGLGSTIAALPSLQYLQQGTSHEIVGGALLRYRLKEEAKFTGFVKESALLAGAFFRSGDAVIPALSLEYANFAFGVSYDINISGLTSATAGKGGIELSLRYINPNPFKNPTSSPKYLRRSLL